ncbi:uncharacterized protein ACR2FA_003669, partial [Aphomia sociella]
TVEPMKEQNIVEIKDINKKLEEKIDIDGKCDNLEIVKYIKIENESKDNDIIKQNENAIALENIRAPTNDRNVFEKEKHYECSGDQKNQFGPSVIWVQFQGIRRNNIAPSMGPPLDYDPESRNSFVKLVFIIVFVMLLCTAGFNFFVLTSVYQSDKLFFELACSDMILDRILHAIPSTTARSATFGGHHSYLWRRIEPQNFWAYGNTAPVDTGQFITMLALNYAMVCSTCARVLPCNVVCLCIAVLAMSVITAYFTVKYETRLVLYALVATLITVFVCILLACSSFDFTKWLLYVVVIAAAVSAITMIISITWMATGNYSKPMHIVILLVGTILNVVILVIELQTILGGGAVELSEDDYALAAFMLYTSIVDLFIKLLQLGGLLNND